MSPGLGWLGGQPFVAGVMQSHWPPLHVHWRVPYSHCIPGRLLAHMEPSAGSVAGQVEQSQSPLPPLLQTQISSAYLHWAG